MNHDRLRLLTLYTTRFTAGFGFITLLPHYITEIDPSATTVVAEKFTNMLCQPFTGRLSDSHGLVA